MLRRNAAPWDPPSAGVALRTRVEDFWMCSMHYALEKSMERSKQAVLIKLR